MSNEYDFDEDEDLFDFDDLGGGDLGSDEPSADAGIEDELAAELDAAISQIGDDLGNKRAPKQPAPAPVSTPSAEATTEPAAPARTPVSALASPRTQLVIAAMVVVNLLLVGLSWRSQSSTNALIARLDEEAAEAPAGDDAPTAATTTTRTRADRDLPLEIRPEGYETLEEASRAMERGEYQLAREMLYGLLAVIDRVEDSARYDVEARASFMIGDTFRFEARAMREAQAAEAAEEEQS